MIICSVVAGECMAPVQMDEYYDDMYSCLNAGHQESIDKAKEIEATEKKVSKKITQSKMESLLTD